MPAGSPEPKLIFSRRAFFDFHLLHSKRKVWILMSCAHDLYPRCSGRTDGEFPDRSHLLRGGNVLNAHGPPGPYRSLNSRKVRHWIRSKSTFIIDCPRSTWAANRMQPSIRLRMHSRGGHAATAHPPQDHQSIRSVTLLDVNKSQGTPPCADQDGCNRSLALGLL